MAPRHTRKRGPKSSGPLPGTCVGACRWGAGSVTLALSMSILPLLHLACHLKDPGYVAMPSPNSKGKGARGDGARRPDGHGEDGDGDGLAAAAARGGEAAGEAQPLLLGDQGPGGGGGGSGASVLAQCSTCKVERPLRSKHCPVSERAAPSLRGSRCPQHSAARRAPLRAPSHAHC